MGDALVRGGVGDDSAVAKPPNGRDASSRRNLTVSEFSDLAALVMFVGTMLVGSGGLIAYTGLTADPLLTKEVGLALILNAVIAVVTGIGIRRALQRQLASSFKTHAAEVNAELLAALDCLPDGVAVWDSEQRLVVANKQYREATPRISPALLKGVDLDDAVETEIDGGYVPQQTTDRWREHRRNQQLGDRRTIRRRIDGRDYRISAAETSRGGSITISHDLTTDAQQESTYTRLGERYTLALAATKEGLWDLDLRTGRLDATPRALSFIGVRDPGPDFNRRDWIARIHPADRMAYRQCWRAHLHGETEIFSAEYRVQDADGSYRWIHDRALALRDSTGKAYRIAGAVADISDRKATEEELSHTRERAEAASRAKSEFLTSISHELRTPLNAIIGFSSLVRDNELTGDTVREYANDINVAGTRLDGIVTDMISIARADLGRLELAESTVDLTAAVDAVLRLHADRVADNALQIQVNLPANLPPIIADAAKIKQVLHNVLSNAIKFTSERGEIEISGRWNLTDGVQIMVRDNGIGMSPVEIAQAAEPFAKADATVRQSSQGAGLGLAIVGAYMKLHGGSFDITSPEAAGTTISLRFPPERLA